MQVNTNISVRDSTPTNVEAFLVIIRRELLFILHTALVRARQAKPE